MKSLQYPAVRLLVALVLLILASPVIEEMKHGDLIEAVLLSAVMSFAVMVIGGTRRVFIIALILMMPVLIAKWVNSLRPDLLNSWIYLVGAVAFFGFVVANLLAFIVRAPQVDANVLCAGVSGFLMIGLLWIPAYIAVGRLNHAAFNLPAEPGGAPGTLDGFTAFYFSFITLCTVGYGDMTPVSKVARMLVVLQALTGLFYMAVLISRLVSLHSSTQAPACLKTSDSEPLIKSNET